MPRQNTSSKCFVPGCNSGYTSCTTKASLFTPPTSLLAEWQRAIPRADRVLSSRNKVCDRHFAPHLIERTFKVQVGDDLVELDREKPRLVKGAIPHLFPNLPSYLSKKTAQPRNIRKDRSSTATQSSKTTEIEVTESSSLNVPETSNAVGESCLTFDILCAMSNTLCPITWNVCLNSEYICFGKLEIVKGQITVTLSVSVTKDMTIAVFYKGCPTPFSRYTMLDRTQQLIEVFSQLEQSRECRGNTDTHLITAISKSRVGVLDSNGVWRHKACTKITLKKDRCRPCQKFRKILQTVSPRSRNHHLQKIRISWRRKVNRLKARVNVSRTLAGHLKNRLKLVEGQKLDNLVRELPANQQLAIRHCFRQARAKSARGMRYDHQWILACLLLRIKSPKAYAHLRDHCFLSLPSRPTLTRYIDVIRIGTGISDDMIELLTKKISTDAERHGILMFDEVKLREGMKFNTKNMEFEGMVDFGEFTPSGYTDKHADTGLVFMYRPIFGSWVQTVGMFLSKGPTSSSILSKLLMKLLIALESHNIWVDGVVCDGSTTNRGVWKQFGISGLKGQVVNSVEHPLSGVLENHRPNARLFFFSDYVHLFKCMRNNLLNQRSFLLPEGEVSISHFVNLLKLDTNNGGLRAVPKLTTNHVEPNNLQRMNVRLAVQLFSNSVADGMRFYQEQGKLALNTCDATISFVRRLNRLFDILNAKLPVCGLRIDSDNMTFLEECLQWLDAWETHIRRPDVNCKKFLSPSTSAGLRVTLHSTIDLSKILLQSGFKYVLTSRLSQDPLEVCFMNKLLILIY